MGPAFPLSLLLMLTGCPPVASEMATPGNLESCTQVTDPLLREECRFQVLQGLIDDPAALTSAVTTITDPQSRDLALLRLAIASPGSGAMLCSQVTTSGAKQKCKQVLGRPHLQRIQPHKPAAPSPP